MNYDSRLQHAGSKYRGWQDMYMAIVCCIIISARLMIDCEPRDLVQIDLSICRCQQLSQEISGCRTGNRLEPSAVEETSKR